MEVLGSISPDEVPEGEIRAMGTWTILAQQVIQAHRAGKVLVVKVKDRAEQKRMVNGMSERLRQNGYARQFTSVNEPDGKVTVYCKLADPQPASVVVSPLKRPRKRANA